MTKEQIHEALCKAPDEDKMRLAIACQLNGIDVRDIETGLANVLTGVQKAIKPAIEYYRYLGVYVQGLLQGVLQRPWIRYTGAYWIGRERNDRSR